MTHVSIDYQHALTIDDALIKSYQENITNIHHTLHENSGADHNFLGWLDLPETFDHQEFSRIQTKAEKIRNDSDIFVVIGIGGSYLGARAAIHLLTHSFQNELANEQRNAPKVIFAGHHLSATYMKELFDLLKGKKISLNIISKSGTTTEPAIAFRIFKQFMEDTYGKGEARQRIYVTTDQQRGALKAIATKEGYETFVIPENIGGRYSVLTAVGLLPIAVSGIPILDMMDGAKQAMHELQLPSVLQNPCYQYAICRNVLYQQGKKLELLVSYKPKLYYFQEWWKQLFGESEGKDKKGLFPAAANFPTDLHSLGQYIQDGERHLFQTLLHVEQPSFDFSIPKDQADDDGLNYLAGKTLHEVNEKAFTGALMAHKDGGVPNIVIHIPKIDSYTFGYLVYFFEKSCAISAYILNVNPFNQPGVENYKENMFSLLGKYLKK